MTKIDPYKNKEKYLVWKSKIDQGIPGVCKENADLLIRYITDLENGTNIAGHTRKGFRSP